MSEHYRLKPDHSIERVELMEWATYFETADRRVANTEEDGWRVSTVFLGLDHQYGEGPPLVFETMVFEGSFSDLLCWRYSTWDEAEAGHQRAVTLVRNYRLANRPLAELAGEYAED